MKYPIYLQEHINGCGPACIKMIFKYFHQDIEMKYIKQFSKMDENGVSIYGLLKCFEKCNTLAKSYECNTKDLIELNKFPYIIHQNNDGNLHYVVLYDIKDKLFVIGDPAVGIVKLNQSDFEKKFSGICVVIEKVGVFNDKFKNNSYLKFMINELIISKNDFIIISFLSVLISILSVMLSSYLQVIIDKIEDSNLLFFILITVIFALVCYFKITIDHFVKKKIYLNSLSRKNRIVLNTITQLPYLDYKKLSTDSNSLMLHKINSLRSFSDYLDNLFSSIFVDYIFITIIFASIFMINKLIFMVFTIVLVLVIIIIFPLFKQLDNIYKESHKQDELFQQNLGEFCSSIHQIKQFKCNKFYKNKIQFFYKNKEYIDKNKEFIYLNLVNKIEKSINFSMYLICTVCFYLYFIESITIGHVILVYMLISYVYEPIFKTISLVIESSNQILLYERYKSLIASKKTKKIKIKSIKKITFDYVSYGYGYGKNIFDNVELIIDKNIILKGDIGSGKSTFLQLCMGFDSVTKGTVLINDIPIEECDLKTVYSKMILLDKSPIFFNESLNYNLLVGNDDKSNKLVALLNEFQLTDLIDKLDVVVDTSGGFLSSGQQQLVLLIRALIMNPDFLLLDEALSNVDGDKLDIIYHYLFNKFEGIVVLVSHQTKHVCGVENYVIIRENQVLMEK